jgi:hypothetical protein
MRLFSSSAVCLAILFASLGAASADTLTFTDSFSPTPSPEWSNLSGNWTASSGDYYAQQPNNNPEAVSLLPFDLTGSSLSVTVNGLADGGIVARSNSADTSYVLLVLGGNSYGQGGRGGNAGSSIYFADSSNPSAKDAEVDNVFTPGNTYTITLTAVGDLFSAYVDGSSTPITTWTDSVAGADGEVGLYDDQPNTTTGSGSGTPTTFSGFSLTGTTVPEPVTGVMLSFALACIGARVFRIHEGKKRH